VYTPAWAARRGLGVVPDRGARGLGVV
jgi:hypothetical protein